MSEALISLCLITLVTLFQSCHAIETTYRIAMIPKAMNNSFFDEVHAGCLDKARKYNKTQSEFHVECDMIDLNHTTEDDIASEKQIEKVKEIIYGTPYYECIAISVNNAETLATWIDEAISDKLSVVTFDSDAPESKRMAFVGTNNTAFGQMLGKVLIQVAPAGGKYSIVTGGSDALNLRGRVEGLRQYLKVEKNYRTQMWEEVDAGEFGCNGSSEGCLQAMHQSMELYPEQKAIIPVGAWPMLDKDDGWLSFVNKYPNVTTIVGDATDKQVELTKTGKNNGLVGQMPYEMGELLVETLINSIHYKKQVENNNRILTTNLLQIVPVPTKFSNNIEKNQLGPLAILGWVLYFIILAFIGICTHWTWKNQESVVVISSQPIFLYLILLGTFFLGSTLIPLNIDDSIAVTPTGLDVACQSTWWFPPIGVTMIFSALFSKSWRIHKIVKYSMRCKRIVVTPTDVMLPFFILMLANVVVLLTWCMHDPLHFSRLAHPGTDDWNQVVSTYGVCTSKYSNIYGSILFAVSLASMIMSMVQAFLIRNVQTEFNESSYIVMVIIVYVQVLLLGIPVILLTQKTPRTLIPVTSLMVFVLCIVTLGLIFVPKFVSSKQKEKEMKDGAFSHSVTAIRNRVKKMKSSNMESYFHKSETQTQEIVADLPKHPSKHQSLPSRWETKKSKVRFRKSTSCPESSQKNDENRNDDIIYHESVQSLQIMDESSDSEDDDDGVGISFRVLACEPTRSSSRNKVGASRKVLEARLENIDQDVS